jgi:hypothetical protein
MSLKMEDEMHLQLLSFANCVTGAAWSEAPGQAKTVEIKTTASTARHLLKAGHLAMGPAE